MAHQRVAMKALPGSAFEVVEAEFFLELLMGLLADPARLDRRGEGLEIGVGREVGQIVFSLAGSAPFADEPDLFARHDAACPCRRCAAAARRRRARERRRSGLSVVLSFLCAKLSVRHFA